MQTHKQDLLAAIAPTQRGEKATTTQRQHILQQIERLERHNPTPAPTAEAALLTGNWRTLYTTSRDLWGLSAIPGIQAGEIYQYIQADQLQVFNIAEIDSRLPLVQGIIAIRAHFQVVSDQRVEVVFEQLVVGWTWLMNYRLESFLPQLIHHPERIPALKIPVNAPTNRPSWLDITYLDETLRIGRGSQGSLFVLERPTP